jgi:formate C-acetyltransferase
MEEIKKYPGKVPVEALTAMDEHVFYLWSFPEGHIIPDKELVLKKGMINIIEEIEIRSQDHFLDTGQRDFLDAALIECRAFLHYVKRHADYFQDMAHNAEGRIKREYFQYLASLCSRVPAHPATSFREALQSIWFSQIATQFDDVANHSLGRLDQYLYPYYLGDIEGGGLSREEARELFFEFWLKFNLGYKLQELSGTKMGFKADDPENMMVNASIGEMFDRYDSRNGYTWLVIKAINKVHTDDGQTMDIAGIDEKGNDATNELSWLVLDAEDELRTFEPKSVIKYTDKTDKNFMKKAYGILAGGLGLPAVTFHETGAKGLKSYGNFFKNEDIVNYSHIGCVELGIPGKSYTDPMNAFLNLPKILLIALNNGYYNRKRVGREPDEPESWDEFFQNFSEQLDYFIRLYTETMNGAGQYFSSFYSRPLVSALVEGCVSKAVPVDNGGSTYWTRSVNCTGFATLVDSLFSIKKLVYDDSYIRLRDFNRILETDYENMEDFRLMIKNRIPKYGNGVKEVDDLAHTVASLYSEIVKKYKTFNGNSYRPGIYSFYEPIKTMGRDTGATPDGRKAGEVLSLNSAPSHGAVKNSLSDVLKSVTAIDHSKVDNASVVDVLVGGDTTPEVIEYIVEYLSKRDVLYVQFTVVDKNKLVEAQKHPARYQDLVVRVTGFSARFVVLPKDTQEEIIGRSYWS